MSLDKLLNPKTVAVIGATEKSGFGRCAVVNMLQGDLGDNLYFVNPNREQVMGKKCYKSVDEIGKIIDLAVICTPMRTVNGLVRELGECGTKGVIIYASGYSEAGEEGRIAQEELKEIASEYGMSVCGPNCAGYINNQAAIYPFGMSMHRSDTKGNIGLVSQSGQICYMLASIPYMNFSYLISSGNCAVTGVEEYMDFLVEDEGTKVIAVYLEGVTKPQKFIDILIRAANKRKPIIVLKVGASKKAQQTTTAHTGSLAGNDAVYDAIFKKYGVIRVDDMEDLIETSMMFSLLDKRVATNSVGIMSLSGGEAAILADSCKSERVELADLADKTKQKFREMLPSYASVNNPLDMTSTLVYDLDLYKASVQNMIDDESVGIVAMGHHPPEKVQEHERIIDFGFAECLAEINESAGKPIVILSGFARKRDPELRKFYADHNIAMFDTPKYGLSAIRRYMQYGMYDAGKRTLAPAIPKLLAGSSKRVLTEHESKKLLKAYGIVVPEEKVVADISGLKAALEEMSFPIVLKIDSPDVPHKTDAGGVRLGIQNETDAEIAFGEIIDNVKRYNPGAKINGVLIQQMLPKGTEVILGVSRDPQFGPMVLVGLGGIFTELFKDCSLYPAPLNYNEAMEMIESLNSYPLLSGYRGSKPLDVDALAKTIVKIGDFAVEHNNDLRELDINPMFVYEKGVYAADALMIIEE